MTHTTVHKSQWQCHGHKFWQNLGIIHDRFFTHNFSISSAFLGGWPLISKGSTISFYLTPFCWKQMNLKFYEHAYSIFRFASPEWNKLPRSHDLFYFPSINVHSDDYTICDGAKIIPKSNHHSIAIQYTAAIPEW